MAYAKRIGGRALVDFLFANWDKLPGIVAKLWKTEKDPLEWCKAVTDSLLAGRSKGNLVCHAGFEGNEGKSFLFRPLPLVYGEDNVFVSPPKSAFPVL